MIKMLLLGGATAAMLAVAAIKSPARADGHTLRNAHYDMPAQFGLLYGCLYQILDPDMGMMESCPHLIDRD